jgi:ribosomal protein L23
VLVEDSMVAMEQPTLVAEVAEEATLPQLAAQVDQE